MRSPLPSRPVIDGLQALAIAAVVAFHAFPAAVRGGFTESTSSSSSRAI